jgi:hypothetical protein
MRIYAKKVEADGYKFDSEMEYLYYCELKTRMEKGEIKDLIIHPVFQLQPAFTKNGKQWKAMNYEADFQFYDNVTRSLRIVDVKGMMLPEFEMHRKLFEYKYSHYELEVLKYSKTTGWVKIEDYAKAMRTRRQIIRQERAEYKKKLERITWLNKRIKDLKERESLTTSQERMLKDYQDQIESLMK